MSEHRIRIATISEFGDQTGIFKDIQIGGEDRRVALFHHQDLYYALDETCPHRGGPLHSGPIQDGCVLCPWHSWRFELSTGVSPVNPLSRVDAYQVEREGDALYLILEQTT